MLGSAGMENTCFKFCASQIGVGFALTTASHFDQRPNQRWSCHLNGRSYYLKNVKVSEKISPVLPLTFSIVYVQYLKVKETYSLVGK